MRGGSKPSSHALRAFVTPVACGMSKTIGWAIGSTVHRIARAWVSGFWSLVFGLWSLVGLWSVWTRDIPETRDERRETRDERRETCNVYRARYIPTETFMPR